MIDRFKLDFETRIQRDSAYEGDINDYSFIYEFELELIREIQNQLIKMPAVQTELDHIEICQLCFSFDCRDVIKLLSQRGDALKSGQVEKAREIEEKLKDIKDDAYEKMGRPKSAFVIFNQEEAAQRALRVQNKEILFYNKSLKFKQPPEPSDIIWENRNISNTTKLIRTIIVSLIITIFLIIVFIVIYWLKRITGPDIFGDINCQKVEQIYKTDDMLLRYAVKEWYSLYENRGVKLQGALKCF